MTGTPARALVRGAVAAALVLAASAALVADTAAGPKPPPPTSLKVFAISGEAGDLVPGVLVSLPVRVENPQKFAVMLTELRVTVGDAGPGCRADTLVVGRPALPRTIAAGGHVVVPLPLHLVADAADACQGATFPLTYTGTALRK